MTPQSRLWRDSSPFRGANAPATGIALMFYQRIAHIFCAEDVAFGAFGVVVGKGKRGGEGVEKCVGGGYALYTGYYSQVTPNAASEVRENASSELNV